MVIADFRTDVGYVETPRELAFVTSDHGICDIITGDVGTESACRSIGFAGIGVVIRQVGKNISQHDSH